MEGRNLGDMGQVYSVLENEQHKAPSTLEQRAGNAMELPTTGNGEKKNCDAPQESGSVRQDSHRPVTWSAPETENQGSGSPKELCLSNTSTNNRSEPITVFPTEPEP